MRKETTLVLLTVLAAIVVLAAAMAWLRAPSGPRFVARLNEAPGLHEGAPVLFRGIEVGGVEHVGFDSAGVRAIVALRRRDVPLRSGDRIRIAPNGIFGDLRLEIVPGPASAPPLADGGVLGQGLPDSSWVRQRALADAFVDRVMRDLSSVRRDSDSTGKRKR